MGQKGHRWKEGVALIQNIPVPSCCHHWLEKKWRLCVAHPRERESVFEHLTSIAVYNKDGNNLGPEYSEPRRYHLYNGTPFVPFISKMFLGAKSCRQLASLGLSLYSIETVLVNLNFKFIHIIEIQFK